MKHIHSSDVVRIHRTTRKRAEETGKAILTIGLEDLDRGYNQAVQVLIDPKMGPEIIEYARDLVTDRESIITATAATSTVGDGQEQEDDSSS